MHEDEKAPVVLSRLQGLFAEKNELEARPTPGKPPQIDTAAALAYRRNVSGLLEQGDRGERKRLVRRLVERIGPDRLPGA